MEPTLIKTKYCQKITSGLCELRMSLGLSSNKVREETDIDVNKIEKNGSNLTVNTLYTLLEYYGVSMAEFFKGLEKDDSS